ncbi:alpha/beta hydrolase [Streptomyces sp. NPDC093085]|uniref:alpha/beta hydrolase n=1 Tax=Streptomyces sp. NPDC093085 TaxID=3155068 RepID=UPI00341FECCF
MREPKETPEGRPKGAGRGPAFWTPVAESTGPRERLAVSRAPGGTGPVVALVHGLEGGWEGWRPLAEALPGYRVYALDLPWRAGNPYRWRAYGSPAAWLRRALDLVPEPVDVLLGHSFGANAVLELLAEQAEQAEQAGQAERADGAEREDGASVSPAPSAAVLLAPFYRPDTLPVGWPLHDAARAGFRRIVTEGIRAGLGERAGTLDPGILSAMADTALERIGPVGFLSLFLQFVSTTELALAQVTVDTLVLAGRHDESLAGDRATALAAAMPAATVRQHPHYGHFCHVEQTADVAAETAAFLAALRTATPSATP